MWIKVCKWVYFKNPKQQCICEFILLIAVSGVARVHAVDGGVILKSYHQIIHR